MEIEKYAVEHRDEVLELIKQFHENSLGDYGFEVEDDFILKYEETHGDTTFVMLEGDKVIGILGGLVVTHPMAEEKVYQESIWYVEEKRRKHGIRLFKHLELWCKDQGIKHIVMAFMHNSMSDRLLEFYKRMGYKPMETHLIKELR